MNSNKLPSFLVKQIKKTISEGDKYFNEQSFHNCTVEQLVRHKRTKAVFKMIFDHGMCQYRLTPLTNSTKGTFFKSDLEDYELAGTGVKEKTYTRCTV